MPRCRHLTPPHLASFVAAIEEGSVTAAASRLHMTQSALSKRLRALESDLGTALVERRWHPLRPTAAGHRLLEYARRSAELRRQLLEELADVDQVAAAAPESPEQTLSAALTLLDRTRELLQQQLRVA